MNFPLGATLWVYEQHKTYLEREYRQKYHNSVEKSDLFDKNV
jgi:hypothetical protein